MENNDKIADEVFLNIYKQMKDNNAKWMDEHMVQNKTFCLNVNDNVVKTMEDVNEVINELQETVFLYPEQIEENIARAKKEKEQKQLKARQNLNSLCRKMVKHIHFSGDACIIYWNDDTVTKSRWDHCEVYDPEKAILAAMARKLYFDTNLYCEVLEQYADDGWKHYSEYILPNEVKQISKEDFFAAFED